jgi:nicotinate-nucleotide pyrophosphorylase (carboxylating)
VSELPQDIAETVARALAEDIGAGDLTATFIPAARTATAGILSREAAVLCGQPWVNEVFRQLDPAVHIDWQAQDGDRIAAGQTLCRLQGPARALLTGERTALNFLQTLSATATAARAFVDAVTSSGCEILDTRKTLPGLRTAQKYATRCGGATNHRMGLHDAVLIKENHIAATGSIAAAIAQARRSTRATVEVEVESMDELRAALAARPDMILLDEFSLADLATAARLNREHGGHIELEASGNISLESIGAIAATGVHYISVGSITKHIRAVDLSMRIDQTAPQEPS